MARRAGVLAIGSNEGERRRRTIRRKLMLEVSTAELSGALAGRRCWYSTGRWSIAGERSAQTDSTPAHTKNRKGYSDLRIGW